MINDIEQYISLSTQKKDGSFVDTPVWFAQEGSTNIYVVYSQRNSGKVKRIRNFPDVKIVGCNFHGKPKGKSFNGKASLVKNQELEKLAYKFLRKKYGIKFLIGDFFAYIVRNYNRRQIIRIEVSLNTND